MAFLIVGGITVSVAASDAPSREKKYARDEARAVDNSLLVCETGDDKNEWRFKTTLMTRTNADLLEVAINAIPVTCSGDVLGGSGSYLGTVIDFIPSPVPGDHRISIDFTLKQF